MGGKKKPTISQLEKRLAKMRKEKEKEVPRRPSTMKMTTLGYIADKSLNDIAKEVSKMKVVTPYMLSSMFKIKMGLAKQALRELEAKGVVKLIDKNRRVAIYVPASRLEKASVK
ncbi:MAG: 30S ribosomal protein S25e [Thermofilum sp. ex4484_15]|nr:MAG: 30S ribosomal protein S25e [Thermofilum sp. ex4484_15]